MTNRDPSSALQLVPAADPAGSPEPAPAPDATQASHDSERPEALVAFMQTQWKPATDRMPARLKRADAFAARRRALSARFPGETLVIPTGHEKLRANDTYYRFRPGSDFFYLTGNVEPDCVLVLEPTGPRGHRDVLFVEPNPGRSDATFYTDRKKGELWVGPRLGVPQSKARFGVDDCRGLAELDAALAPLGSQPAKWRVLRGHSDRIDQLLPRPEPRDDERAQAPDHQPDQKSDPKPKPRPTPDQELAQALAEMRLIKDAHEIAELQAVVDITARGFDDVVRAVADGGTERNIEGIFHLRARVEGNDLGYGTIAACGAHACILHWHRNDGPLVPGELLLVDAGVEGHSLYTADITRTLPITGRFTPEQREIYDLVRAAQKAAIAAVRPGIDFMEPNRVAMEILAEGLERLGILASASDALAKDQQLYRRYTLHNISHMLGLDVHDCARARDEDYKHGKLKAGMVLTVEPGLYFQTDDLTVPARYRGIGIRLEDDVLVTARGSKVLSAAIPVDADDVERWMARLWKAGKRRG
jgi:Xaa-Pro aminopeptidase